MAGAMRAGLPLEEYLVACLEHAAGGDGDILECGSGLSTLLLGGIAQRSRRHVWSLEHHRGWAHRVQFALAKYGIDSVHLCVAPLKNYGDFTWYDAPLGAMPPNFALVVCDGPPGETHGGRFGLLPIMKSRPPPAALILLDGGRKGEQTVAARWGRELNTMPQMRGQRKQFIEIRVPEVSVGRGMPERSSLASP
jgi:hypothetical protein